MARAYSQDLRDRAIDAALAGLPARHAAARFGIGDLPLNFHPVATRVTVFDSKRDRTTADQLRPQHFLYFLPYPHGHGSLRPAFPKELDWVGGVTLIPLPRS